MAASLVQRALRCWAAQAALHRRWLAALQGIARRGALAIHFAEYREAARFDHPSMLHILAALVYSWLIGYCLLACLLHVEKKYQTVLIMRQTVYMCNK